MSSAKGTSAWLVPLANVLKDATGSWHAVFAVCAAGRIGSESPAPPREPSYRTSRRRPVSTS